MNTLAIFLAMTLFLEVTTSAAEVPDALKTVQEKLQQGELVYDPQNALAGAEINHRYMRHQNPNAEVVVLVHGLGGSQETWEPVLKELQKKYHVLTYDQRGHGGTPYKGYVFSSTTMAHDLKNLLDHLGIAKAHLIGHSMGGRTVLRFAQQFKDRTLSVVVEDMHAIGRRTLLENGWQKHLEFKKLRQEVNEKRFTDFYSFRNFLENHEFSTFGRSFPQETKDGVTWWVLDPAEDIIPLYYSQGLQEDLTACIKEITAPVTFLSAGIKPVLFGKGVEHLTATRPDFRIVNFPLASHGIHYDKRVEFVQEVTQAMSANPGAANQCAGGFGS